MLLWRERLFSAALRHCCWPPSLLWGAMDVPVAPQLRSAHPEECPACVPLAALCPTPKSSTCSIRASRPPQLNAILELAHPTQRPQQGPRCARGGLADEDDAAGGWLPGALLDPFQLVLSDLELRKRFTSPTSAGHFRFPTSSPDPNLPARVIFRCMLRAPGRPLP
jgi:hypothetical protein